MLMRILILLASVALAHATPLPQPKVGQCPSGYAQSGGFCNPMRSDAPAAISAFSEIAALARETAYAVSIGDLRRAATIFDYWGGTGAWRALRPSVQAALMRWVPKASLDFHALMEEPTPLGAYANLAVPVLILRGEYAPRPARLCWPEALGCPVAGSGRKPCRTHVRPSVEVASWIRLSANEMPAELTP